MEIIIVSACLVGINCRYDGSNKLDPSLLELLNQTRIVPICPEQLGGLPTPRIPAGIKGGDGFDVLKFRSEVVDREGNNVTSHFLRGADETLKIVRLTGSRRAILKDKSPSCGVNHIYRDEALKKGAGVLTALLINNGIQVNDWI